MTDRNGHKLSESEMTIRWCDIKNEEAGKKRILWLQIEPEDNPGHYVGIDPETKMLNGPHIEVGKKYKVTYHSPVRLPFIDPKEGVAVMHIAEITGTLKNALQMENIDCVVCDTKDYSVRDTMRATLSQFRLYLGDRIEEIS